MIGGFVQRRCAASAPAGRRRVLALDGKTVRGSRGPDGEARHLLAVIDQQTRAVLGQVEVAGKTNEITAFAPLLDTLTHLDLTGVVITADALHTQREHVADLRARGAHWVRTVKGNQPRLRRQLAGLPWPRGRARSPQRRDRARAPGDPHDQGRDRRGRDRVPARRAGPADHPQDPPVEHAVGPGAAGGAPKPSTRSPTCARTRPAPTNSPPGFAATGRSRTVCTGSATSPSLKTTPKSAPVPDRRSWPHCRTWRSACTASPEPPTSPQRYDITPATLYGHSNYSRSSDFADPLQRQPAERSASASGVTSIWNSRPSARARRPKVVSDGS